MPGLDLILCSFRKDTFKINSTLNFLNTYKDPLPLFPKFHFPSCTRDVSPELRFCEYSITSWIFSRSHRQQVSFSISYYGQLGSLYPFPVQYDSIIL